MANSTYVEKLKDPRWQKKRLRILKRDKWKCRICGCKDKQLQIHHLAYHSEFKNPWDYPDSLLMTVCEEHHEFLREDKFFLISALSVYNCILISSNLDYKTFWKEVDKIKTENKRLTLVKVFKMLILKLLK
jgi:hypothetical protein